jgi:hypothetical protein
MSKSSAEHGDELSRLQERSGRGREPSSIHALNGRFIEFFLTADPGKVVGLAGNSVGT